MFDGTANCVSFDGSGACTADGGNYRDTGYEADEPMLGTGARAGDCAVDGRVRTAYRQARCSPS